MKYLLVLLTILLSACAVMVVRPASISKETIDACRGFCAPHSFKLAWRSKYSYFCECADHSRTVVGSMGTIYR